MTEMAKEIFDDRFDDYSVVDMRREAFDAYDTMRTAMLEASDAPVVSHGIDVPPLYLCDDEPDGLDDIEEYVAAISPKEKHIYIGEPAMEDELRAAGQAWEDAMDDPNLYISSGISESGVTYSVQRQYDMPPLSFEYPSPEEGNKAIEAVDWSDVSKEARIDSLLFMAGCKPGTFIYGVERDEGTILDLADALRTFGGFVSYEEEIHGMKPFKPRITATRESQWVDEGSIDEPTTATANGRFLGYPEDAIEAFDQGDTILAEQAAETYGEGESLRWIEFVLPDTTQGYEQAESLNAVREQQIMDFADTYDIDIDAILAPAWDEDI
ncbi:MAG: hypothetical protein MUP66_03405 [Candidatus Nanohaloarchaeota archaeon QJJ-5]|nr:hypothetical protein [Candidatus Nanohaloarchaeota archaeon QJJ-5]